MSARPPYARERFSPHGRRRRPLVGLLAFGLLASMIAAQSSDGTMGAVRVDADALRLGFISDAQEERTGRAQLEEAIRRLDGLDVEMLLYGGDTSYGHKDAPWEWKQAMEPFEGRTLFVYGNHDTGNGYEPYHPDGPWGATWWSWEDNGTVVVGLDTNRPLWDWSQQARWLNETLAEHANDTVILLMHKPWWVPPSADHEPEVWIQADAEHMDSLVQTHGVDLVLAGHEHYYSRIERNGSTYIITGPVEAQTRPVPWSVVNRSEHATSNQTWMYFDVLPCGIAGWTYDARDHFLRDSFVQGDDVRTENRAASCRENVLAGGARSTDGGNATSGGLVGNRTNGSLQTDGADNGSKRSGGNRSWDAGDASQTPSESTDDGENAAGDVGAASGPIFIPASMLLVLVFGPGLGVVAGVVVGYAAGLAAARHKPPPR